MRVRVRITRTVRQPETTLFGAAVARPRARRLPFLLSVAAHAGLLLLPPIDFAFDRERLDLSVYEVEYIRLRVPEPIYYRSSAASSRRLRAGRAADPQTPAARPATVESRAPRAARRFRLPARLELPSAPGAPADALLLQPDIRLTPNVPQAVPAVALWARQTPPARPPRRLVLPGRTEETPAAAALSVPPVLAVANREAALAELNIAAAVLDRPPALPVPPSATVPIRLRDGAGEPRSGPLEPLPGDAANLIALSAAAMPAGRVIAVLQGMNVRPAGGGAGDDAAGASIAGSDAPETAAADTGATAGNGSGPAAGNAADRGAGGAPASGAGTRAAGGKAAGNGAPNTATNAAAANGAAAGATPAGGETGATPDAPAAANASAAKAKAANATAAGSPAAPYGAAISQASALSPAAAALTRLQHPPNGLFDVVITQSSAGDEIPEAEGVLTGSPVYTVYLPVGGEREWRMLFCLPGRAAAVTNVYQVNAEDTGGLAPPYPIFTVVPSAVLAQPRARYAVLRGRLTAGGRLRNVAAVDPRNPIAALVIPLLDEWEFRPARKDDQPVEVEVLLAIPPRT